MAVAASAQPVSPDALRVASLAAGCAACHGSAGAGNGAAGLPALAGRPAAQTAAQLRAWKAGTLPGTLMPQLARGYSEVQIDALAAYFADPRSAQAVRTR